MNGQLTIAGEPLKDSPARGIGEGLEKIAGRAWHEETITERLWFVNPDERIPETFALDNAISRSYFAM